MMKDSIFRLRPFRARVRGKVSKVNPFRCAVFVAYPPAPRNDQIKLGFGPMGMIGAIRFAGRDPDFFGPGEAHQLSNNGTEDFAYYVIADNPRHDSCYYPDSGKWAVSKESSDYIIVQGTETDYYKDEE
jgi:hypothetical protein